MLYEDRQFILETCRKHDTGIYTFFVVVVVVVAIVFVVVVVVVAAIPDLSSHFSEMQIEVEFNFMAGNKTLK
jgi:hypothetical protein